MRSSENKKPEMADDEKRERLKHAYKRANQSAQELFKNEGEFIKRIAQMQPVYDCVRRHTADEQLTEDEIMAFKIIEKMAEIASALIKRHPDGPRWLTVNIEDDTDIENDVYFKIDNKRFKNYLDEEVPLVELAVCLVANRKDAPSLENVFLNRAKKLRVQIKSETGIEYNEVQMLAALAMRNSMRYGMTLDQLLGKTSSISASVPDKDKEEINQLKRDIESATATARNFAATVNQPRDQTHINKLLKGAQESLELIKNPDIRRVKETNLFASIQSEITGGKAFEGLGMDGIIGTIKQIELFLVNPHSPEKNLTQAELIQVKAPVITGILDELSKMQKKPTSDEQKPRFTDDQKNEILKSLFNSKIVTQDTRHNNPETIARKVNGIKETILMIEEHFEDSDSKKHHLLHNQLAPLKAFIVTALLDSIKDLDNHDKKSVLEFAKTCQLFKQHTSLKTAEKTSPTIGRMFSEIKGTMRVKTDAIKKFDAALKEIAKEEKKSQRNP